jgi:hypothetical protein
MARELLPKTQLLFLILQSAGHYTEEAIADIVEAITY